MYRFSSLFDSIIFKAPIHLSYLPMRTNCQLISMNLIRIESKWSSSKNVERWIDQWGTGQGTWPPEGDPIQGGPGATRRLWHHSHHQERTNKKIRNSVALIRSLARSPAAFVWAEATQRHSPPPTICRGVLMRSMRGFLMVVISLSNCQQPDTCHRNGCWIDWICNYFSLLYREHHYNLTVLYTAKEV